MTRFAGILEPLVQLTLVRFREFYREPEAIFWVLVFPLLVAAALGLAFRNAPPPVLKVAAATPALADALSVEKEFDVRMLAAADAETALRTGKVVLVAEPGPDGGVFYRYDATNPDGRAARMMADRAIQRAGGQVDPVATSDHLVAEPGSRYIDFLVPGLVGMTLMTSAIWGVGYTIVDARRRHLLKRLVAAPMPRSYFLLSFLVYRLAMMLIEAGAVLAFGVIAFGVPLRGPFVAFVLSCMMTTLACTALGLLIAARVRTTEAVAGLTNFIVMPMWIVSGVFFSAQRFPDWLQPAITLLPLSASIDALRANMLEGAGTAQIAPELAILAAWMVTCFVVALRIFRWR
jgi:ABC-2 type transport system permease protein